MHWNTETLSLVYDKTDGYCRYCKKKLAWSNYGRAGERGAWEVDHSVPLALGGTNLPRNLWPACADCNSDKGILTGSEYKRLMVPESAERSTLADVVTGLLVIGVGVAILRAFAKNG